MKKYNTLFAALLLSIGCIAQNYPIVDTRQTTFYDNTNEISAPTTVDDFYGQDAHYNGNQADYTDNLDGTISDNITGLMWTKTCDYNNDGQINADDKMSYTIALAAADTLSVGGYSDWRLPTIKEQYSLIMFNGIDPSGYTGSIDGLTPFIDTEFFNFGYGDESAGERIIDAQFATSTLYVSTTMMGDETMFGVNFADGRIKGYGTGPMPGQTEDKEYYVYFVRGNENYGINEFSDNQDQTITDNATGLMWTKDDSGVGMTWQDALAYAESSTLAGYDDWRLPNAKELQSIIDYTRAPDITSSAAIDPIFNCTAITDEGDNSNYPFYWTNTTHINWTEQEGGNAAYLCFGDALGFMEMPPESGSYNLLDVHGAGSQRSDPKTGNPEDYPYGHGPQGDVIRIYNYVRLVRNANSSDKAEINFNPEINVFPNPAKESFKIYTNDKIEYKVALYNPLGQELQSKTFIKETTINTIDLPSGIYHVVISTDSFMFSKKIIIEP